MKIAMVTHEYPPHVRGGCGISCELLVRHLRKNGIYVDVFVFDEKMQTINDTMGNTYHFNVLSHLPQIINLTTLVKLKIDKRSYDLIHVYGVTQIPVLKILQTFNKIPVVATLNGFEEACADFSSWLNHKCPQCKLPDSFHCIASSSKRMNRPRVLIIPKYIYFILQRWLSKKIDYYIALSDSIKNMYISAGFPEEKIIVIPNMLDPAFIKLANKTNVLKYGTVHGCKVILYIGNLNITKGVDVLINAFSKLSLEKTELWIIGKGVHETKFKKIAEKSPKNEQIKFIGYVKNDELPSFYKAANVFVHPGIWPEPFGRTIIEAMVCKLPVITSDVGAPPNIVGNNGFIYKANDEDELAQKLEYILADDVAMIRLGDSAHHDALSKYWHIVVVNRIIKQYSKISKDASTID